MTESLGLTYVCHYPFRSPKTARGWGRKEKEREEKKKAKKREERERERRRRRRRVRRVKILFRSESVASS